MRKFVYVLTILLLALQATAQQRVVSGTVTNGDDNQPVLGATVGLKGAAASTQTDSSGKFSIAVPDANAVLTISYVGFTTQEIQVGTEASVSVILNNSSVNLNEVVVVGYSTERRKDLKGAVAVVKMQDLTKETNANVLASLQGRVAGVTVTTNGAPGTNATVNIRGISSILGDIQPLYVVDGVPTKDISNISPTDIESMQIMKDAASAAIYGARGANGVVVITTRTGKSSEVKVTLDAFVGVKKLRGHMDMLNTMEYGQVLWQQKRNDNQPLSDDIYGTGPEPTIPAFIDDAGTIPSADVDYQKEVYSPASNMAYNLGLSKASDKSTFFLGLNYNRENGLAKYTVFERLSIRLNSSFRINKRLTIGENLSIARSTDVREADSRELESAIFQHPIIPIYDNLGNWGGPVKNLGDRLNPVGRLYYNKDNASKAWRIFGNVFGSFEILKGLSYNASFAVDAINANYKGFQPTYTMGRFTQSTNTLSQNNTQVMNLTATHTLTYQVKKGAHDVQLLAGYEWINNTYDNFFATRQNFALQDLDYQYLNGGTSLSDANGGGSEYGLIGSFGKLNYAYADRYLFSASIRRDGSSRFGKDNRYGVFPAVSAAWRISEEKFFSNSGLADKISDLKIRGSWGKNGNDGIPDYTYVTNYSSSVDFSNYDLLGTNGLAQVGYYSTQLGNPNVKWEASKQTNIGLDLGMFNNRLYVTADYYIKTTDDLLYPALTPAVIGEGNAPYINVGDIRNKGLELMVSYRKTDSKFKYNFDLTFTSIKNEVLSVGPDGNDIRPTARGRIIKGQPLFVFYGYHADGIFKSQKELDDHADQPGKGLGRIRFRDTNGDGVVDVDDRDYLGSPFPKFTAGLNGSFSYGNLDATFFFDATVGNKIYDEILPLANTLFYNSNHGKALLDAWTPDNADSDIPMLTSNNTNDEVRTSSFYMSDGSYLRLKSAVVGFTFPSAMIKKVGIASARVFVQAQNVFEITKFKGFDYEPFGFEGILSNRLYPHSRSFTVGLNVGF